MLQVARLAPKLLGESAGLVRRFVGAQQNPDGGFRNRDGKSDLYYTVFGVDCLVALQEQISAELLDRFVSSFLLLHPTAEGSQGWDHLDFIHLCCLARCWSALSCEQTTAASRLAYPSDGEISVLRSEILNRIETYRTPDGGYNQTAGAGFGTTYGCFLAWGAYQDLNATMPDAKAILCCLDSLRSKDDAFANRPKMPVGSTSATAAAVALIRQLGEPVPGRVADWLLAQHHKDGGFPAAPNAPIPDLLSTATALHALVSMEADIARIKEPCLDFVDSLWCADGGFYGHWKDDALDVEYTYYGLLALGHLSL